MGAIDDLAKDIDKLTVVESTDNYVGGCFDTQSSIFWYIHLNKTITPWSMLISFLSTYLPMIISFLDVIDYGWKLELRS